MQLHIACPTGRLCNALPLVVHVQHSWSGGCSLTATGCFFLSLPHLHTYLLGRDSGADADQLPGPTRMAAAIPAHQGDAAGASSCQSRVSCLYGSRPLPPPTFCVRPWRCGKTRQRLSWTASFGRPAHFSMCMGCPETCFFFWL